jgi:ectoine hydroxylase-related dioxygenase (phytanoyl-CoA dioxygenase family)
VEKLMRFDAQRDQFAALGYAVFDGALSGAPLELLRGQCADFVAREDQRMDMAGVDQLGLSHRGTRYFANECQREQPALRQVLFSEVMADICRATLGENAYFFFDQFVVKGRQGGLPFSWHQDSGYVVGNGGPADHAPYLTCWIALDDATVENGTVRLLPFSAVPRSRDEIIPHWRDAKTADLIGWDSEAGAISVEVSAGSVVAFSSRLLHATGANQTDKMRRVYLAQYTPEVMLNPGTKHLRRNAIAFLRDGRQVTRP